MLQQILCICSLILFVEGNVVGKVKASKRSYKKNNNNKNCWLKLEPSRFFEKIEILEAEYAVAREKYVKDTKQQAKTFDTQTLNAMLQSRGRIEGKGMIMEEIPAGMNLGGYSMLKNESWVMFFHRMKLRNSTIFQINLLETDLGNMVLKTHLNLNDLHLLGSFERAYRDNSPSNLYYMPTYGLLGILLKNVVYAVEGRLRFLYDSPYIVLINSVVDVEDAMISYQINATEPDRPQPVLKTQIGDFIDRLKTGLDQWLKDFFNHYLIFFKPTSSVSLDYRTFQRKRTDLLNAYAEKALSLMKQKLHSLNASAIRLPSFNIATVTGLHIELTDGALRGLDTLYRRSVATGYNEVTKIRKVDAIVGFSFIKVSYKYTIYLTTGMPPLNGLIILSADEITAQLTLSLLKNPETVDITVHSIQELKEKALTIEGPANRMIPNFKHVLEHHILTIMSNLIFHNIRDLSSLSKCEPPYVGIDENIFSDEVESTERPDQGSDQEPTKGPDEGSDQEPTEGPDEGSDQEPSEGPDEGSDQGPPTRPDEGSDQGPTEGLDEGSDQGPPTRPDEGSDQGPTEGLDQGPTEGSDQGPTEGSDQRPPTRPDVVSDQRPTDGPDEGWDQETPTRPDEGSEQEPTERPDEGSDHEPTEGPDEGSDHEQTEGPDEGSDHESTEGPDEGSDQGPSTWPDEESDQRPTEGPDEESDQVSPTWPDEGSDQGPTEGPDDGWDQGKPTRPDEGSDQEPTEGPDEGSDQEPPTWPDEGSDKRPTEGPDEGSDQGPPTRPGEGSDQEPTVTPDDGLNEISNEDDKTTQGPYTSTDFPPGDHRNPDYFIKKEDSVEIALAPNPKTGKSKKYRFLSKQSLSVKGIKE